MAEATTTPTKTQTAIKDFTVEFGDSCNRTIKLSTLREKLRGSWSSEALHSRPQGGRDIGAMNAMPPIPGQRMRVISRNRKIIVFDPLDEDKELLERISKVARSVMVIGTADYRPVPRREQVLSEDQFKTLLHELRRMADTMTVNPDDGKTYADPKVKVVDGELPDVDAIESLPGHRLYDPGYNGHGQPRYAKDVDAWMRRVDQQGVM